MIKDERSSVSATSSWWSRASRACSRRSSARSPRSSPIVFLGWEPHPMNTRFDMRYLTGGDSSFGPNYGGATVYTNMRAGYLAGMPERRAPARRTSSSRCAARARSWPASSSASSRPRPRPPSGSRRIRRRSRAGSTACDASTAGPRCRRTPERRARRAARGFEAWVTGAQDPARAARSPSAIEFIKTHGKAFFAGISIAIQRLGRCA